MIPALDPSPVIDTEKNTISDTNPVRFVSSDNALPISLDESSWDSDNSGKIFQKNKIIEKQKGVTGVIKRHQCKFCSRYFKSSQALGGHTSKAHPAMSIQYAKKMQVRRKN